MPKLSVTSAGAVVPAKPGRKQLILINEGPSAVRYGWEPIITANNTAATDGALLVSGASLAFGGRDLDISNALKFITAAGDTATLSYTERA
jgi:hypothetical protein